MAYVTVQCVQGIPTLSGLARDIWHMTEVAAFSQGLLLLLVSGIINDLPE